MLYHEQSQGEFVPWTGYPINEVQFPKNIAQLWTDEQLAEIGLFRPVAGELAPHGMRVVETQILRVEGVVREVPTLEEIPLAEKIAAQKALVERERDRRIAQPLTINLDDGRSFPVQTDPKSREIIAGLSQVGNIRLVTQSSDTSTFHDMNNDDQVMSPMQLISMGMQVAAMVDAIYKKSFAIKARPDYPDLEDVTVEALWT